MRADPFRDAVLEAADYQCQYVGTGTEWKQGASRCEEREYLHVYRTQPSIDHPRAAVAVCSWHYQLIEQYMAENRPRP